MCDSLYWLWDRHQEKLFDAFLRDVSMGLSFDIISPTEKNILVDVSSQLSLSTLPDDINRSCATAVQLATSSSILSSCCRGAPVLHYADSAHYEVTAAGKGRGVYWALCSPHRLRGFRSIRLGRISVPILFLCSAYAICSLLRIIINFTELLCVKPEGLCESLVYFYVTMRTAVA